jgi:hypothetical protein
MASEPITPPPSHNGAHVQVEKRARAAAAPAYTRVLRWMLSRLVPVGHASTAGHVWRQAAVAR